MRDKEEKFLWWQREVIYQIYPRSFKDSNGDGIGDLQGIIEKLDYLKELGIGAIWISPFFPSPMADFGYDVSDYCGIHPIFGDMNDFDQLLKEVHDKGLKLILDFVPNHTSEEHDWFKESRSSRNNPKRDWYIWKDPGPDGGPPNNWVSEFGGKAWQYDEITKQYYYHTFLKEQPDLNWRNPEVQEAMFDAMRFWLDKGVDGYRVDVMWHMIKDDRFRNNPENPAYKEHMSPYRQLIPAYSSDQPEVHDIVEKMRDVTNEYEERVLIGEIYLPIDRLVTYYGHENSGAHLPFNFQLIVLPWEADKINAAISEYEASLPEGGWPNWVLGNHDKSRILSRVGKNQARVAAMLLLTLRGTPTMYYGDEIGMEDVKIPPDEVKDPHEKNVPGKGLGRDPERTPMQWDSSAKAGFTTGEPWLPISEAAPSVNVEMEKQREESIYSLYKKLLQKRKEEPALHVGAYVPLKASGNLIAFRREKNEKHFLIILNLGHDVELYAPEEDWRGKVIIATHREWEEKELSGKIEILPDLGVLIELKN